MLHTSAATRYSELSRGGSTIASKIGMLLVLGLATIAGIAAIVLTQIEARWLIYALLGLGGVLAFVMTARKDALLVVVFMLGLQMDIHLRLGYGRAGSSEGIVIPFVFLRV